MCGETFREVICLKNSGIIDGGGIEKLDNSGIALKNGLNVMWFHGLYAGTPVPEYYADYPDI